MHRARGQHRVLSRSDLRVAEAERGERPNPLDAAFLAQRYRAEFGLAEVPVAVQRILFPIMVAVGTLIGRYSKYADAPEPVRR